MKNLTKELLDSLSREYGDSYYILDSDVFKDNSERLISSFKKYYDNFNIAYSYKTNYIPKLVKAVDRLGGFAEVVSDMEFNLARRIGFDYKGMQIHLNIKSYITDILKSHEKKINFNQI